MSDIQVPVRRTPTASVDNTPQSSTPAITNQLHRMTEAASHLRGGRGITQAAIRDAEAMLRTASASILRVSPSEQAALVSAAQELSEALGAHLRDAPPPPPRPLAATAAPSGAQLAERQGRAHLRSALRSAPAEVSGTALREHLSTQLFPAGCDRPTMLARLDGLSEHDVRSLAEHIHGAGTPRAAEMVDAIRDVSAQAFTRELRGDAVSALDQEIRRMERAVESGDVGRYADAITGPRPGQLDALDAAGVDTSRLRGLAHERQTPGADRARVSVELRDEVRGVLREVLPELHALRTAAREGDLLTASTRDLVDTFEVSARRTASRLGVPPSALRGQADARSSFLERAVADRVRQDAGRAGLEGGADSALSIAGSVMEDVLARRGVAVVPGAALVAGTAIDLLQLNQANDAVRQRGALVVAGLTTSARLDDVARDRERTTVGLTIEAGSFGVVPGGAIMDAIDAYENISGNEIFPRP